MPTKKDLDNLRGELGEIIVSYELMKKGWDVYKNLGGQGFDLIVRRDLVQRRLEVKTTDTELRTGSSKNQLTVLLSESELQNADFLVFCIMHMKQTTFFVIPKKSFPTSGSVTVNILKTGEISTGSMFESFRNQWSLLD
jgi:hypothetical protein